MRINYNGNYNQIITAVEDANDILNSEDFYTLISNHGDFKCSEFSSEEVSSIIKKSKLEIEVKIYKPRWRFSKVLGYFVKSRPNNIFLNSRKIYRDTNSITNTIVHEYIHAVDNNNNNSKIQFGHSCTKTLASTAPYIIGDYAEMLIDGNEISEITSLVNLVDEPIDRCLQEHDQDNGQGIAEDISNTFNIEDHRVL